MPVPEVNVPESFDEKLRHPGRERLLAQLRRKFWILQGRAAVWKVQGWPWWMDCRRFRRKPQPPRMADHADWDCSSLHSTLRVQTALILFSLQLVVEARKDGASSSPAWPFALSTWNFWSRWTPARSSWRSVALPLVEEPLVEEPLENYGWIGGWTLSVGAMRSQTPCLRWSHKWSNNWQTRVPPSSSSHRVPLPTVGRGSGRWNPSRPYSTPDWRITACPSRYCAPYSLRWKACWTASSSRMYRLTPRPRSDYAADAADWPRGPFPATRHLPRQRDVDETMLAAEPGLGRSFLETKMYGGIFLYSNPLGSYEQSKFSRLVAKLKIVHNFSMDLNREKSHRTSSSFYP